MSERRRPTRPIGKLILEERRARSGDVNRQIFRHLDAELAKMEYATIRAKDALERGEHKEIPPLFTKFTDLPRTLSLKMDGRESMNLAGKKVLATDLGPEIGYKLSLLRHDVGNQLAVINGVIRPLRTGRYATTDFAELEEDLARVEDKRVLGLRAIGAKRGPGRDAVAEFYLSVARGNIRIIRDGLRAILLPAMKKTVSVNRLLENLAARDMFSLRNDAQTRLTLDLHPGVKTAHIDKGKIWLTLHNLVKNASQAGAKNVIIRTKPSADGIRISVWNDNSYISPELKEKLYARGASFESGKGNGRKSSGLGLYSVKNWVDAHNGKITITSRPGADESEGKGITVFNINLPKTNKKIKL